MYLQGSLDPDCVWYVCYTCNFYSSVIWSNEKTAWFWIVYNLTVIVLLEMVISFLKPAYTGPVVCCPAFLCSAVFNSSKNQYLANVSILFFNKKKKPHTQNTPKPILKNKRELPLLTAACRCFQLVQSWTVCRIQNCQTSNFLEMSADVSLSGPMGVTRAALILSLFSLVCQI